MLTAAMLAVLAADPEVGADDGFALFTAPVAPVLGAGWAAFPDQSPVVFVPLGAAFSALGAEWSVDAAVVFQQRNLHPAVLIPSLSAGARGCYGTWWSAGPVIHSGVAPMNGFFLSPRFVLGVFFVEDQMMVSAMAGLDAGWQVTVGSLYVALVFGASIGVGSNDSDEWAGPLVDTNKPLPRGTFGFVGGLNLQVLRIGWVF